MDFLLIIAQT